MTPREFCTPGKSETLKLAIHSAMLAGSVACATYNIAAWIYRRETHNAVNGILYSALTLLEVAHVQHHLEKPK